MRLITIDNGNTNPNVAIFENGKEPVYQLLKDFHRENDDFVIMSSVGKKPAITPNVQLKDFRKHNNFFDMPVDYTETLGDDRLVAGYFAFKKKKAGETVLVIDAGTFITCDLINDQGFRGGFIFPGIERFLSIYSQSEQLPRLDRSAYNQLISIVSDTLPHTTEAAIALATKHYLKSAIETIINENAPGRILITGGSADDIQKIISSKVLSEKVPHLIHSALQLLFETHLRVD